MKKSSPEQIRARFEADVERFSKLETGQQAAMDSPLILDLVAEMAPALNPKARSLVDIGCGAGNYTLRLMQALPIERAALIDLSPNMLTRARERVQALRPIELETIEGDIRSIDLGRGPFDIAVAAAVLHHLRSDAEWSAVFAAIHASLSPGGSFWIADLVDHAPAPLHEAMWQRYGRYLEGLGGIEYRDKVFAYVEQEDTPRPVPFLLEQLRQAGFAQIEVLHKNGPFALLVAIKAA
jgi:tRNA (cmo5U34)-methyltransferase